MDLAQVYQLIYDKLANAFHALCVNGIGDIMQQQMQTIEVEVQRRRFWSWYLMHCHNTESFKVLDSIVDVQSLPLPWCEDDFSVGTLTTPTGTLTSTEGSTSIFAELAKVMTIW